MSAFSRWFRVLISVLAFSGAAGFAVPVQALDNDADKSLILVARPDFKDALYGASILVAKPMPDGSTFGFIINKPTRITLGQVFPEHPPSLKVPDPVFLGGPVGTNLIFALVESDDSPGEGSIPIAPGLFLAIQSNAVDHVIEAEAEHARFLAGMVVWRPGELAEELKRGLWYTLAPDAKLAVRKRTEGLWEEMVQRSEQSANTI